VQIATVIVAYESGESDISSVWSGVVDKYRTLVQCYVVIPIISGSSQLNQVHVHSSYSADMHNNNIEPMCACVCCGVQLLCLARVVLSKSRVVIIDEVMMVVSDDTEQIVHRVVRTAFSDRTVINLSVNYLAPPTYMCTRGHQPVVNCPPSHIHWHTESSTFF